MSFETVVQAVRGQSDTALLRLFGLLENGAINRVEFLETGAQILATSNSRASAAGEAIFRDYMETTTGTPYALRTSSNPWNPERLEKALATVLAADKDTFMQLERIARAEPLNAAQRAYGNALEAEPAVKGWTRGLDSQACQLCTWWWREGRVWPKDHPMPTHTGCLCHQVPAIKEEK